MEYRQSSLRRAGILRGAALAALAAGIVLVGVGSLSAQQPAGGDPVAALKQSLQTGMAAIHKYQWIETTTLSLKGEQKSVKENSCYYGADGKVQKVPVNTGADEGDKKSPRGLRGRVVENKKEEMTDYMNAVGELIKQYVPPDPAKIQAVKDAFKMSVAATAPNRQQIDFRDYLKAGDVLSVIIDPSTGHLAGMKVASYLDKPDNIVTLDVTMTTLSDGALFASEIILNGESEHILVNVKNGGHKPMSAK